MNPYLLKSLEFGPVVLERIVALIPSSRFDEHADPDRFTVREAVAHIVDFEPIFRTRVEDACRNPGVTVVPRDEEQMAIDNDYASQDVFANLKRFREERVITAKFLRALDPSEFEKIMVHPEIGPLKVEDVANMLLGHDLYHIEHVSELIPS